VSFRKNLINNTLTIVIKEHQTSIVWQTAGEKFLVNRYGVVYDVAGEKTPLILVEDLKNLPVSLNQKVVAPDFIEFVTSFVANLPRKTNISIERITIPETTFEVEMYTNQKWRIILDTTRPPDDQLNALVRVLREMGDDTPREYVDLRIPNKVFYK
jgi:cell division septal protein FtsQ